MIYRVTSKDLTTISVVNITEVKDVGRLLTRFYYLHELWKEDILMGFISLTTRSIKLTTSLVRVYLST